MKSIQSIIAVAVVLALGAIGYQYFESNSLGGRVGRTELVAEKNRERIESVEKDSRTQGATLEKQAVEIKNHGETLGVQTKDIADLQKRVDAAEGRLTELAKAAEGDRAEIDRRRAEIETLRGELEALVGQKNDDDRRRKELEDLRGELKRSLERSIDMEKRLSSIEKQLGIERPQP